MSISSNLNFWAALFVRLTVSLIALVAAANWCLDDNLYQASPFTDRVEHALALVERRYLASVPAPRGLGSSSCVRVCGSVPIPYPFGLSTECALNPYFQLECRNTSHLTGSEVEFEPGLWPFLTNVTGSFKAGLGNGTDTIDTSEHVVNSFQILFFNLTDSLMTINTTAIKVASCNGSDASTFGSASIVLPPEGPYRVARSNVFFVAGCRAQSRYSIDGPVRNEDFGPSSSPINACGETRCTGQMLNNPFAYCNSLPCCLLSIAPSKKIFFKGGGHCGDGSILFPSSYKASADPTTLGTYGLLITWALDINRTRYPDCKTAMLAGGAACSPQAECKDREIDFTYAANLTSFNVSRWGYYCRCLHEGFEGDGYLHGSGCQDVDECKSYSLNQCADKAVCKNRDGSYSCSCPAGMMGDGYRNGSGCSSGSDQRYIIIGLTCGFGGFVLLSLCVTIPLLLKYRKQVISLREAEQVLADQKVKPPFYSYNDLKAATRNFHPETKLGEGAFGVVYKGVLVDGTVLAMKTLFNSKSNKVLSEFLNEVVLITGLKHRNLIQLKGCCIDHKRILVYEYAPNGNLEEALWGMEREDVILNWRQRFNICLGVARGLSYLHEELQPRIIHRDIKPANILLDSNFNPKIADFGLAKSFLDEQSHVQTIHVAGTRGYFAPEYVTQGELTEKVDVYSFGILVLEIVSGKKCIDNSMMQEKKYLKDWAQNLQRAGLLMDLLQPEIRKNCNEIEVSRVINIALLCAEMDPKRRASMSQVVAMLLGTVDVIDMSNSLRVSAEHYGYCRGNFAFSPLQTLGRMEEESDEHRLLSRTRESSDSLQSRNSSKVATIRLSDMIAR